MKITNYLFIILLTFNINVYADINTEFENWKVGQPCFKRVNLSNDIPKKYLNASAKKLHNRQKLKSFSKFITNIDDIENKYEKHHWRVFNFKIVKSIN